MTNFVICCIFIAIKRGFKVNCMKKTYRNVAKSQKLIRDAVISLLGKKKDLNAITVTDVVKVANINRGTFYNHYNNITEVVNEIEDELMELLTDTLKQANQSDDYISTFINSVTQELKKNEEKYKLIVPYIPQYLFDDMKARFLKSFTNNYMFSQNPKRNYIMYLIISNGIVGTYLDYFENKLDTTLNEIAEYTIDILKKIDKK